VRFLHHDAGARQLAVLRIAVFGMWSLIVLQAPVDLYADVPSAMWNPRGLAHLVPLESLAGSGGVLIVVKLATVVLCGLCVIGVRPFTPIALGAATLVFVHDAMAKSLGGYTNHAQLVLLLITVVVALFPAADALAVGRTRPTRDRQLYAAPVVVSSLILVSTYLFIGLRRLVDGGLAIFVDGSFETWLVAIPRAYGASGTEGGLIVLDHRWMLVPLAAGFALVTAAEVASPLALRITAVRRPWIVVIVAFHLTTWALMRITFLEHLVLIVVLLTRLSYRPFTSLASRSPGPGGAGSTLRPGTRAPGPGTRVAEQAPPSG
jgi:hypothetical protein